MDDRRENLLSSTLPSQLLSIDEELWQMAEERAQEILWTIEPNVLSEVNRKDVIDYVQKLIRGCYGSEVLPFGSVPLKTYLPDGDIDLTALSHEDAEEDLAQSVLNALQSVDDPEYQVKDIQDIRAQVRLLKCTVKNIAVDISFNQMAGLYTLRFLEQVDQLVGKNHIFKRSIILIKAWCYYESRLLGGHHGLLSTYAIEILVLYIINRFHSSVRGPLEVLFIFLDYYGSFDWDHNYVSIWGPKALSSLPEIAETPECDQGEFLLQKEFLRNYRNMCSFPARASEPTAHEFPVKFMNILDPLRNDNNLGRSVNIASLHRLRFALSYGARKLKQTLTLPGENMGAALEKFFFSTLDRNGKGERADVDVPVSPFGTGRSEECVLRGDCESYYGGLQYIQLYRNYAMPVSVHSSSPSRPSQDDILALSRQQNWSMFYQGGTDVYIPGQTLYHPTYSLEEGGKSRGTGTYIPDSNYNSYWGIRTRVNRPRRYTSTKHISMPKSPPKMQQEEEVHYETDMSNGDSDSRLFDLSNEDFPLLPCNCKATQSTQAQGCAPLAKIDSETGIYGNSSMSEPSTQPIDVSLLDATVAAFYGTGSKEQRTAADQILRDLQNNPDMWLQVMHILQNTQSLNTKFFALQVLEGVIKYRWNALPAEQRDGMKNFISDVIVQLSRNEVSFRTERLYVNKLDIILVQILKHEWPVRWRSFIPDLVSAAKTSETICQNCMAILKLLSEEVFDFSRGEMTQQKIKELKQSLNSEFQLIHELCLYVLSVSQRTELIRATLSTLHAFLSWIPLGYIFESPLLETLLNFFPVPAYQNLTLQCLTEVAVLQFRNYYDAHIKMYNIFMVQLQSILPPTTNIPEAYAHGSSEEQAFIQNVAMFFTSFFKVHIRILESTKENITALLLGLEYLINISYVDDTEVFKVCLDYWNVLVAELFEPHRLENPAAAAASMMGLQVPGMVDGIGSQLLQRRQLYAGPMSKLRMLMISRMAKPEEVLIVEDENGNLVRETMKDNAVLVQYKIMRETLIYLSHLDHDDTEKQMLRKLSKQLSGEDWTWNNLNTLCWAIGSISGSMLEEQENRFLVMVIRDLLNLCEITKGKENKAVIASNIMYVVGQYPRFLRAHWKFLKTVVNKLFEFMHETHPGVQDMACDTFLKIVQKCKRKFVITQVGENGSFVSELLTTLPNTIADLEPHQIHSFYESVGYMIQAESDVQKRDEYLQKLMVLPNQRWMEIIGKAHQNVDFLKDQDVIRNVLNILQTNTSVASSLGTYFLPQITLIFLDVLNVYRMYSELISKSITEGGPFASRTSYVKLLRSVKRETLKLVDTFLDKAEDQPQIAKHFVPPMMDPVLGDYARNVPDARESEVLSLFATIVNKYKAAMVEDVPRIFEAVFQCTLEMITKNFEDYPEHRLNFFSLLRAIATHCFPALICLSSQQLKLVMDSIIWAFRHTERNIAETGLNLLFEMLKKFQVSEFCNQFYRTYFLTFEQEIFAVLTDTFHKPGFKLHVLVLQHLFCLADSGSLTEPLWDAATNPYPYPSNAAFVREFTIKLLSTSFPNMTASEVTQFVNGLFESTNDLAIFKTHIRDFLVQSKEFSAQDNKDLYAEEAAAQRQRERQRMLSIPGLVAPSELQDEMVDS